jgi:hypothetical protein
MRDTHCGREARIVSTEASVKLAAAAPIPGTSPMKNSALAPLTFNSAPGTNDNFRLKLSDRRGSEAITFHARCRVDRRSAA